MLSDLQLYMVTKYASLIFDSATNIDYEVELYTDTVRSTTLCYEWVFTIDEQIFKLYIANGVVTLFINNQLVSSMPLTDEELQQFADVQATKKVSTESTYETFNPITKFPYIYTTYDMHSIGFTIDPTTCTDKFTETVDAVCIHARDNVDGYAIVCVSNIVLNYDSLFNRNNKHLLNKNIIYALMAPYLVSDWKDEFSIHLCNVVSLCCRNCELVLFTLRGVWYLFCLQIIDQHTIQVTCRNSKNETMVYTVERQEHGTCFVITGDFNTDEYSIMILLVSPVAIQITAATLQRSMFATKTKQSVLLVEL